MTLIYYIMYIVLFAALINLIFLYITVGTLCDDLKYGVKPLLRLMHILSIVSVAALGVFGFVLILIRQSVIL